MQITYNILEPAPYWPDTGQAQITSKDWLAFAVLRAVNSGEMVPAMLDSMTVATTAGGKARGGIPRFALLC